MKQEFIKTDTYGDEVRTFCSNPGGFVAKETYESHGVNYLAMRKKLMKRRQLINNIIGIIISFFIVVGFFVIMYFLLSFSTMI